MHCTLGGFLVTSRQTGQKETMETEGFASVLQATCSRKLDSTQHLDQLMASLVEPVRFQVLTAASMMFRAVFWVILPCKIIVIPDD
jgi:hypothetical protein